ncbi:MAG: VTT domain-containing protein [Chloroflexi bacterium]|nr:VTT domain-containing protein [Chloroflexota bacterium]
MTTIRPGLRFDRRLVTVVAAITLAILLPVLLQNYVRIDAEALAGAGYAALFLIAFVSGATFFLPVPILPLVFAGASLFNPGLVALVAATGMALGMGLTYFLGAWIRDHLNWRVATRADRLGAIVRVVGIWLRRSSVLGAFILAATPNPVYDFAGVIAGSAQAPLGRFMAGVFLGKLTQALIVAIAGFLTAGRIPGLS